MCILSPQSGVLQSCALGTAARMSFDLDQHVDCIALDTEGQARWVNNEDGHIGSQVKTTKLHTRCVKAKEGARRRHGVQSGNSRGAVQLHLKGDGNGRNVGEMSRRISSAEQAACTAWQGLVWFEVNCTGDGTRCQRVGKSQHARGTCAADLPVPQELGSVTQ